MSRINLAFDRLVACDDLVIKAMGVTEISQVARSETRMREYLLSKWQELSALAVKRAVGVARSGGTAKEIASAVNRVMGRWADEVKKRYLEEFSKVYFQARIAGWKKANGLISEKLTYDIPEGKRPVEKTGKGAKFVRVLPHFDIVDGRVVDALKNHQVFWIGDHYESAVARGIAQTAKEWVVEAGRHPREAIDTLRTRLGETLGKVTIPSGYRGSAASYFEGVAANAATVARVQGQMRSFIDYGVTTYEIVNPRDSRTCESCVHMDGKTFSVRQGADVMEESLAAKTPEQVKSAQPWMDIKQIQAISSGAGKAGPGDAGKLAEARFCLPPFHFKCRCTVDISEDAGSWRIAGPSEEPRIPAPPGPPPSLPPSKPPVGIPPLAPATVPPAAKRPPAQGLRKPRGKKPAVAPPAPQGGTSGARPPMFPPAPQRPTTPNQLYSEDRLVKYLKHAPAPLSVGDRIPNSDLIRREFNALCAAKGMYPRDIVNLRFVDSNDLAYATTTGTGGSHWAVNGEIKIGETAWTRLQQWSMTSTPKLRRQVMSTGGESRWSYHVVTHETVHGHGPDIPLFNLLTSDTERKVSQLLEEVVTESATIKIVSEQFGGRIADMVGGAFIRRSIYTEAVEIFTSKIDKVVSNAVDGKVLKGVLEKAMSLPEFKGDRLAIARQMLTDASFRFKQLSKTFTSFGEYVREFGECFELPPEALAGLTKPEAVQLTAKVRKEIAFSFASQEMQKQADAVIKL